MGHPLAVGISIFMVVGAIVLVWYDEKYGLQDKKKRGK